MAEKKEKNSNGILSIFTKEYKYEGIILLALSLIALVLGTMVLIGETSQGSSGLVINKDIFLIGDYPKAFAWILIILGAVSCINIESPQKPSRMYQTNYSITYYLFFSITKLNFGFLPSLKAITASRTDNDSTNTR
jgi:hypothetical protein